MYFERIPNSRAKAWPRLLAAGVLGGEIKEKRFQNVVCTILYVHRKYVCTLLDIQFEVLL